MFPSEKIRSIENTHILLWLLKDTCWVLNLKMAGMVMIVPTVAVAAYLTTKAWHDHKEFFFNLAVLCWILANGTWMVGEFYFDDGTRNIALVFFVGGLLSIGYYYAKSFFSSKKS